MRGSRGLKDSEAELNQKRWLLNDEYEKKGLARVDCIGEFRMGVDGAVAADGKDC